MTLFDRIIRLAVFTAVATAIIASFTVRAHGATVTFQTPPCLKAPIHHVKHKTVALPATPAQTCVTPPATPPCFVDDIPEAVAAPHPTYIVLEYPTPEPDAAPTLASNPPGGDSGGFFGWFGGGSPVPPRFPGGGYSAPEMDANGWPTALAMLGMLAAIAAGRRS